MAIHEAAHEAAGKTVIIKIGGELRPYNVEDWWDRVAGKSWMDAQGNPAAIMYGMRSAHASLPIDNEVVYGKIGSLGHLVHVSEIQQENVPA